MNPPLDEDAVPCTSRSALDWARESGMGHEMAREIRVAVLQRRRRRRRLIGVASVLLLLSIALFRTVGEHPASVTPAALASAVITFPERAVLPDGSTVELRGDTRILVEFTPLMRGVTLLRGEAHFRVSKEPARPFVVAANGVEVRAVGTAFVVQIVSEGVEVLVSEGRVAVEKSQPAVEPVPVADVPRAIVDAGQRITVDAAGGADALPPVDVVSADELAQRLSWRVPRLEFSGTPLSEVVALFQQHGRQRLTLGDRSLEAVRISGILRADNSDALLQLLSADYGIVSDRRADGIILLPAR